MTSSENWRDFECVRDDVESFVTWSIWTSENNDRKTTMDVTIRRARPDEAKTLSLLARLAKRHWGYCDEWMQLWRRELTFTPEYISANDVYVADSDGIVMGVYGLIGFGDEIETEHFWVHPDVHGRGVGQHLFEHMVSKAISKGAERIKIVSDPNAEGFYNRMGAKCIGTEASKPIGRCLPVLCFHIER